MNKPLLTLAIIIVLASILYFITGHFQINNQPIPCTQEARICPDGTTIKRTGPNCQFTACSMKKKIINETTTVTPMITHKIKSLE